MDDKEKLELYERVLKAIARQPDTAMYRGTETHPMFRGMNRQHWASTVLSAAGVEHETDYTS